MVGTIRRQTWCLPATAQWPRPAKLVPQETINVSTKQIDRCCFEDATRLRFTAGVDGNDSWTPAHDSTETTANLAPVVAAFPSSELPLIYRTLISLRRINSAQTWVLLHTNYWPSFLATLALCYVGTHARIRTYMYTYIYVRMYMYACVPRWHACMHANILCLSWLHLVVNSTNVADITNLTHSVQDHV